MKTLLMAVLASTLVLACGDDDDSSAEPDAGDDSGDGGGDSGTEDADNDQFPADVDCNDNDPDITDCGNGTCEDGACTCEEGYDGANCDECASGYQDNDDDGTCLNDCTTTDLDCGDHGDCDDSSGTAVCDCDDGYTGSTCADCDDGYQDNDDNDTCEPDCETAELDCGEFGVCDDSSGTAICDCDDGYQDNDDNGTCEPDCETAALTCPDNSECDDSSGTAVCVCYEGYTGEDCDECDDGYQDNDDNGTCELDCTGAGLDCGDYGDCDDSSGEAVCVCDTGWAGDLCDECAFGYHDVGNGCEPSCEGIDCGDHGECDDTSGPAFCDCDEGYQDNDENFTCEPDCDTTELVCDDHGECDDSSGEAICVCDAGYQDNDWDATCEPDCDNSGLSCLAVNHEECDDSSGEATCVCLAGYQDNDGDGDCEESCATADLDCSGNGECDDSSGTAVCACYEGHEGASCSTCSAGYQDNDDDGHCSATCATAGLDCGVHGVCSDTSGTAICDCDSGWGGAACEGCGTGYQDNDENGTCVVGCSLAGLECGDHGYCDDSSGAAVCECETGYEGVGCATCSMGYSDIGTGDCAPDCWGVTCGGFGTCDDGGAVTVCNCLSGYQDNDGDLVCTEDCDTATWLTCDPDKECDDSSGTVACACVEGLQDNDENGTCEADCSTAGLDCGYGTCDDSSGTAVCACDEGYQGAACDECAAGYQDNDEDDTCEPDCASSGLDCGEDGECYDDFGEATCVCDMGRGGASCDDCAAGYQDNDGDDVCEPDCASSGLDCGDHGECDDTDGAPVCECDHYYQDNDGDGTCLPVCALSGVECEGDHAACDDDSGTAECGCEEGYQNNDGDTDCLPDCTGVHCNYFGVCDDRSGETVCLCDEGYQDNDGDLECMADCETANPDCHGNGTCDDSLGTAECVCETGYTGDGCDECDSDYQDNNGDGTCELDCAHSGLSCIGAHRYCDDGAAVGGVATCVCDPGYQDNDDNGTCVVDCASSGLDCGDHGDCDDSGGTAVCDCDNGYTGTYCESCNTAWGYQDNDGDGTCEINCTIWEQTYSCNDNGDCDDSTGTAHCECDNGFGGAYCNQCAFGYSGYPTCGSDCAGVTCSGLGTCYNDGGVTRCNCNADYQDEDGNLTCTAQCSIAGLSCGTFGHCDHSSGTAICVCDSGYQNNGNPYGECTADCTTAGLDCGDYGDCDDSSGTPVCVCDTGYTGGTCESCDPGTGFGGYQDNDTNGTCEPDCQLAGLLCSGHGACVDASGTAICDCDIGHAGGDCGSCDTGYQDSNDDGSCNPDCATSGLNCDHGECDYDLLGIAVCVCEPGYDAAGECTACITPGYQDNDTNGTCEPDCTGVTCGGHGTCEDDTGTAVCDCDTGYQDNNEDLACNLTCQFALLECPDNAHCEDTGASGLAECVCDTGYQDNDGNDTCLEDCSMTALDCGDHGVCDDRIGLTVCDCDVGWAGALCTWDLERGLVFHFGMDGDLSDDGPTGYSAIALGTGVTYDADPFGDESSVALDGATRIVVNADLEDDLIQMDEGTFVAWVRWDGTLSSQTVFDFGDSAESTGVYRELVTGNVYFYIGSDSIQSAPAGTGQWYHLAATVDDVGMRLYLNAQLAASAGSVTGPMFPSDGTSYLFGRSTNAGDPKSFTGRLDDVRLYDRALSAFELSSLYASGFFAHRTAADWDGDGTPNTSDGEDLWPNAAMTCPEASCTWEIDGCGQPWEGDEGHVYWYCPTAKDALEAATACAAQDAYLVSIGDEDENWLVWSIIDDDAWIGAYDGTVEGDWEWVNGDAWGYESWAPGEPDDGFGESDCAVMHTGTSMWYDYFCMVENHFVCEYDY